MLLDLRKIIHVPGESVEFQCELSGDGLDFPSVSEYRSPPRASGRVYNEAGILRLEAEVEVVSRNRRKKRYEDFSKYLHKVYLALAGLCVVVCIGAVLLGRWGLNLLFGKDILQYYDLFMPIIWCTILTAFIWVLYAIVVAMRQIKWLLVGMIADFILCLAITRPCIAGFGKNGVSVSQIVAYGVYVLFIVILCESVLRKEKRRV